MHTKDLASHKTCKTHHAKEQETKDMAKLEKKVAKVSLNIFSAAPIPGKTFCDLCERSKHTKDWASHKTGKKHCAKEQEIKD
jgi:hypothetical protein